MKKRAARAGYGPLWGMCVFEGGGLRRQNADRPGKHRDAVQGGAKVPWHAGYSVRGGFQVRRE